jgi:hypothetical protein
MCARISNESVEHALRETEPAVVLFRNDLFSESFALISDAYTNSMLIALCAPRIPNPAFPGSHSCCSHWWSA